MHVSYRCQHAGACCTSRWPVPIETDRLRLVREAAADGRVAVRGPWLIPAGDAPDGAAGLLAIDEGGHCVFHQHERCAIQGAVGHDALPSACQHFPRVCLIDARGVFVTLSHYCPTAGSMLFDDRPVSIVEGPQAVPGHALPEGLDARDAWPPLLTPCVLMDHESYAAWERHMVEMLAGEESDGSAPEESLARLRVDAEQVASWTPGDGALIDRVGSRESGVGSRRAAVGSAAAAAPVESARVLFDLVRRTVPSALAWAEAPPHVDDEWRVRVEPAWIDWAPVVRRYLAAHAFASWIAYQGRGIVSIVHSLDAALAVLKVELVRVCQSRDATLDRATLHHSIRQADLLLRHHADREALACAM